MKRAALLPKRGAQTIMNKEFTSERFDSSDLFIMQPSVGHRYGSESMALAEFCRAGRGERVAELGSGVGVISLMVAARDKPNEVVAVEIQEAMHRVALMNVENNNLCHTVRCVREDYRKFAEDNQESFDMIFSNPPFYAVGDGRISPNPERAAARHELNGTISDLLESAHAMLRPGGRFVLVFTQSRCEEAVTEADELGFSVRRMVKEFDGGQGPSFLAEFEK
jgi:tRNA1(Val) A37 N6-methylase TrmN6